MSEMRAAVIAAGLGSRFAARGVTTPKPLVPVAGRPLVEWTLRGLAEAGFPAATVIFNESIAAACSDVIRAAFPEMRLDVIRRGTRSSYESFLAVVPADTACTMIVSTVDAMMPPGTLRDFVRAASGRPRGSLVLGVTDHIDDEKPLYVACDGDGRITSLGRDPTRYVTCGVYCFPAALCHARAGEHHPSLRRFLGALVEDGVPAYAVDCGRTVDVDHPEDIADAESLLGGVTI